MKRILLAPIAAAVAARETVRTFGSRLLQLRTLQSLAIVAVVAILTMLFPAFSHAAQLTMLSLPILGATNRTDIATLVSQEVIDTFKEVYLEALDAIPDATPLTAQLEKGAKVDGAASQLTFNVKLQVGGGVANVGDGQQLPVPTRPVRKKGTAGLAHTYTVIAIGGQSVPLTKKTRNAFVSNLEDQLEDGMERVKFDLERQYNGDGRGILCLVETIAGAPVYGAQNPYGYTYAQANVPGTMLLVEGMKIAHVNPAGGAERGRSTINSINFTTDEYTTAGAIAGTVIGDYVVLVNDPALVGGTADASTNYLSEANGIGAVIGSGTFEGIAGTYRRWQTVDIDMLGAQPREKDVGLLDQRVIARSGQKPQLYYTSRGIVLAFQDALSAKRTTTGESLELKGGYEGLKLNGRVVLPGDWCPKGHLYALNTAKKNVAMVDVVKMGYVDLDGSKLHRIEGRHAYRADLWFPHNAIWTLRAAQGRIQNWADDLSILR